MSGHVALRWQRVRQTHPWPQGFSKPLGAGPGVGRAHSPASQESRLWFLPLVSSVTGTWRAGALSPPLLPEAAPPVPARGSQMLGPFGAGKKPVLGSVRRHVSQCGCCGAHPSGSPHGHQAPSVLPTVTRPSAQSTTGIHCQCPSRP